MSVVSRDDKNKAGGRTRGQSGGDLLGGQPRRDAKCDPLQQEASPRHLLILLVVILIVQAVASLTLRNTAFEDEALFLNAGHQILGQWLGGPHVSDPFTTYFSGLPYIYPVIGGFLDRIGGLETARFFSLACMLLVTVCVFRLSSRLFNPNSALPATLLFAFQSTVLFIGRMATYDALCLLLLALASVLAVSCGRNARPSYALVVGLLLALAIATIYGSALFAIGILALLCVESYKSHGLSTAAQIGGIAVVAMALALIATFFILPSGQILEGFDYSTTNRVAVTPASLPVLIWRVLSLGGIVFGLASIGMLTIKRDKWPQGAILLLTALMAPVYHFTKGEFASLHKHIAFAALFAAPLAGVAISRLLSSSVLNIFGRPLYVKAALCIAVLLLGVYQGQSLFHEWPNTTLSEKVLSANAQPGERILSEESRVYEYDLQDKIPAHAFYGLYWFQYTDKNGNLISGDQAYEAAVSDGYFNIIELYMGNDAGSQVARDLQLKLLHDPYYQAIAKIPYATTLYGRGYFWIWRKQINRR